MDRQDAVAERPVDLPDRRRSALWITLAVWGPGLVVMLADTDAGSVITAAQSGATWGYRMVLPQLVLVPFLYVVQEMTVRLGVCTGKGHGALIKERFGTGWAYLSSLTLLASCVGALLTEFAGVAGVGQLFGVSKWVTVPVATVLLVSLALTRSYRRVERVGIAFGLAELALVPAMLLAHPSGHALLAGLGSVPTGSRSYRTLLAANIGAVIMPWMVFYQQGAVIDKGLTPADLRRERQDTAVGALISQAIMVVVVILLAATAFRPGGGGTLSTVGQIVAAVTPALGGGVARALVGAGLLGAALVAALVVSLAGAWGMAEVAGWQHSLNRSAQPGPGGRRGVTSGRRPFLLTYSLAHILGAVVVLSSLDLVGLAVDAELLNALLLPIVLGFLLLLEARALPPQHRMTGAHRVVVTGACLLVMAFGLYLVPLTLGV